jgi:hypothetical protein
MDGRMVVTVLDGLGALFILYVLFNLEIEVIRGRQKKIHGSIHRYY